MALTRDFKETVKDQVERDPAFREELRKEGFECLSGDADTGIATDRIFSSAHRSGKLCGVPHLTVIMGDHRPEPRQHFRCDGDTKLGDVSLKKGTDKALTPLHTTRFGVRQNRGQVYA